MTSVTLCIFQLKARSNIGRCSSELHKHYYAASCSGFTTEREGQKERKQIFTMKRITPLLKVIFTKTLNLSNILILIHMDFPGGGRGLVVALIN